MVEVMDNAEALVQEDAVWLTELPHPGMDVHGSHCEVVFVATHELCQGAGHRQGQGLHVPHLLPEALVWSLVGGLLVGVQLVGADACVRGEVQVHVPA